MFTPSPSCILQNNSTFTFLICRCIICNGLFLCSLLAFNIWLQRDPPASLPLHSTLYQKINRIRSSPDGTYYTHPERGLGSQPLALGLHHSESARWLHHKVYRRFQITAANKALMHPTTSCDALEMS